MSFQDLQRESTPLIGDADPVRSAVASGIFQLNTAVSAFRRLVDAIGTSSDTPDLRVKLRDARSRIGQLVKETSGKLRDIGGAAHPARKATEIKLARDFQAVLAYFQKAQKLAEEREKAYAPTAPSRSASLGSTEEERDETKQENRRLMLEHKRQALISLDNEISFNEAMIEERDQGIKDIQYDIGQINEVYKDLAVLISNQQPNLDDIGKYIESTSASAAQGKAFALKSSRSSRWRSSLCFWVLIIFVLVALVILAAMIIF
ncbi:hypothetical protein HPP92_025011 [Vanilla planifolia]|uniref:t-SNARE coiled-coil homology domain-containing protein n=1 Tax=Vanilla planifolia TaxID=51239 RepID=A0A835PLF3_VANPL|nr:hypothetical protein HPP92_025011 [Vanilla planifolia]